MKITDTGRTKKDEDRFKKIENKNRKRKVEHKLLKDDLLWQIRDLKDAIFPKADLSELRNVE